MKLSEKPSAIAKGSTNDALGLLASTRLGEMVQPDRGQNAARLERIRALIDDGEIRLARTILEALLQDYPDFRVPPDKRRPLSSIKGRIGTG